MMSYEGSKPDSSLQVSRKLDELITLLDSSELDNTTRLSMQQKFNDAMERSVRNMNSFKVFEDLEDNGPVSREEMLDSLEILLSQHELDSKLSKKYLLLENAKLIVQAVIAVTMMALGFAMIILPAPPYFEMFTIFHFTENDGVTLMDVISLLIVLSGVYLLITSFLRMRKN